MIPLFSVNMPESVDQPLLETLHSGYITQGPKVEAFEAELNRLFQTEFALTVNSGTSALTLALRLAGVGHGDEVITTPMTCSATNLPILSLGGIPVFADVHANSGLLDPASVVKRITPKTRAIMVVDWGGAAPELTTLRKIADQNGLKLIEDCAHSFGAAHTKNGLAHFTCFSLQAIKHITTGDGGVLICEGPESYKQAKLWRWFGINREGQGSDTRINEEIETWGYKFHMNDLNATIGLEQLKILPAVLRRHKQIADHYNHGINAYFVKPPTKNAYWLYTMLLPTPETREAFKSHMQHNAVQVSQVHRRNDHYKVFKPYTGYSFNGWHPDSYPGVDAFANRMICIPIHTGLSRNNVQYITTLCNEFAKTIGAV